MNPDTSAIDPTALSAALLRWYRATARDLPWRRTSDPYAIWISEVMLQQTRVVAVIPYYERFLRALPTLADLARCPEEQLYKLWEGLGYYSRARNLHRAAAEALERYGALPTTAARLAELPGFGPYTSAAVASIAFGEAIAAIDGNVRRVFARLVGIRTPIEGREAQERVASEAARCLDASDPGAWNQAVMELGATICTPRGPRCEACPVAEACDARRAGDAAALPVRSPKKARPEIDVGVALVCAGGGTSGAAQGCDPENDGGDGRLRGGGSDVGGDVRTGENDGRRVTGGHTGGSDRKRVEGGRASGDEGDADGVVRACEIVAEERWLICRRPDTGLLAKLWTFPLFEGETDPSRIADLLRGMGLTIVELGEAGEVDHAFTHRIWHCKGHWYAAQPVPIEGYRWATAREIEELAFPAPMWPYLRAVRRG